MSSRTLNRKDFLIFSASSLAAAAFADCSSGDPNPTPGAAGTSAAGAPAGGAPAAGAPAAGAAPVAGAPAAGAPAGGAPAGGAPAGGASGSGGSSGAAGSAGKGGASGSGGAAGGSSGSGGHAGGGGSGMCGSATITQTAVSNPAIAHTHVSNLDAAILTKLKADLKALINGSMATAAFTLPSDGPTPHTHTIQLTTAEVTTLLANGTVTGKITATDSTAHTHTYSIGCTA